MSVLFRVAYAIVAVNYLTNAAISDAQRLYETSPVHHVLQYSGVKLIYSKRLPYSVTSVDRCNIRSYLFYFRLRHSRPERHR